MFRTCKASGKNTASPSGEDDFFHEPEGLGLAWTSRTRVTFACGYGTVLFFEDQKEVKGLQEAFPSYQENFPGWSLQTSAMHQLAIWVMLEDVGFGASLQHYNPLIDEEVRRAWDLPEHWHLIAEMPFGLPLGKPGEKEFQPLEERVRIFK